MQLILFNNILAQIAASVTDNLIIHVSTSFIILSGMIHTR